MRRRAVHATRQIIPRNVLDRIQKFWALLRHHLSEAWRAGRSNLLTSSVMAVSLLLIGMLLLNFGSQVLLSARLESQRAELAAQVSDLEAANQELRAAVEFAESDVNVERIAREQLGYARDGDVVVLPQIAIPTPTAVPAALPTVPTAPPIPNWQLWYAVLFGD